MGAGFVALGQWQLERRVWKLALIARVDARVQAAPVAPPPPDEWAQVSAARDEYRHVRVAGRFLHDRETLVQASTELGSGAWVVTPLQCDDGTIVLVNRGFVPPERRVPGAHGSPAGGAAVVVTGLLRLTEPGGTLLQRNDAAAGRWYSRDVQAIAAARGLGVVAPYFIDADAAPRGPDAAEPVGGLTVIDFHNHHAIYALTWFALALLALVAVVLLLRDRDGLR
jgi:surfeit locus 1 family protein